ncbi:hypothetical protein HN031_13195 [Nocardioides sp. zg-1308]|uniref:Uncharacterized protein n=1 Tax=Nocardioides renjunii TaxID=3095075 RepID=A0ABU5KDN6_9ACTN|nr:MULTISPECIES: hypothetical protein [unclassified Nocardioides]MDZ5662690.1 hypothetical protein [Nocardioides sp. S-58]NPD05643.1 hypothetical protein [Nocardioides sp. zg-1308]WQQ23521.1 hypothetical protein SHK17_05930 [Nocardioides sp. S-34]
MTTYRLVLGSPAIRVERVPRSVLEVLCSDRASEGETRLLRGLLGLAAQPTGHGQVVAASQFVRLSQARGHLRACEFFMHEIHVVASISVGIH